QMRNVGDATGFDSQTTFVLPIQGTEATSYLYLGDRWGNASGGTVNDSRYVWLPITFPSDTSIDLNWAPQLTIDTSAGSVEGSGGPYQTLSARHSDKCVDVPDRSQSVGQQAVQWECNSGNNQRFWAREAADGHVQLVARHSSLCLAVADGSDADGTAVVQATCGGGAEQQWQLTDAGDGYVTLVARNSGRCLDVADESTADGTGLIQYTCTDAAWQQFRLTEV
ncbi:beta-xylosidase, partial [Streptomyces sp. 3MP-14]